MAKKGYHATAFQVRQAWEKHFGRPLPGNLAYSTAAKELASVMGWEKARKFILSQPVQP